MLCGELRRLGLGELWSGAAWRRGVRVKMNPNPSPTVEKNSLEGTASALIDSGLSET